MEECQGKWHKYDMSIVVASEEDTKGEDVAVIGHEETMESYFSLSMEILKEEVGEQEDDIDPMMNQIDILMSEEVVFLFPNPFFVGL